MIVAEVLTPWLNVADVGNAPMIYIAYREIAKSNNESLRVTDITQQPVINIMPNPNLYVVRVVTGDVTFTAMLADSNYQVLNYVAE